MGIARWQGCILALSPFRDSQRFSWIRFGWMVGLIALCAYFAPVAVHGADVEACRRLYHAGQYDACIEAASEAIRTREYGETWPALKAQSELFTGRATQASETLRIGLERYTWSVQLRLLAHHADRCLGKAEQAEKRLKEIDELASRAPWRYTDCDDLLALGEAGLMAGADPKDVLEGFFERARKQAPSRREPWLAIGMLALEKGDNDLAAETFEAAAKKFPEDADIQFGMARAFAPTEPMRATAALTQALKLNPRHVPALMMQVDQELDAERYDEAEKLIERALETNPRESDAWAFRAVIAHLKGDPRGEAAFRDAGGGGVNPSLDHLIGLKLSQKYRFVEGAAAQRRALAIDPKFVPAKVQLAQDLLRLGDEEEGWKLAAEAHQQDGYHVGNFNLLELKDRIAKFKTLEDESFIVRMDAKEAEVYGQRVLQLLNRAKHTLCAKYELDLKHRITVEIFPDENDFAVRTFGMPAGSGYLGVCFGKVITANSPASQKEHPANWESVLWHEFCHVVTLELTQNKMPRWLSEGISVYEELQENPSWGQRMNPRYREIILGGGLTPVDKLSGAFLHANDPIKLSFAYYQSCLVVEFIARQHGHDSLKKILRDLRAGLPINTALDRHTDGLEKLDAEFGEFAHRRAEELAPQAEWDEPKGGKDDDFGVDRLTSFVKEHPNNVMALSMLSKLLVDERRFAEARPHLEHLISLDPQQTGGDNAFEMLARVHRELRDTAAEAEVLERYARIDSAALPVYLRLVELHREAGLWDGVYRNASRGLAVNPLIPSLQRAMLDSGEATGHTADAIHAGKALLALDRDETARTHYRLARLLQTDDRSAAKRHILQSLEEAPRFRDAQQLLLKLNRR